MDRDLPDAEWVGVGAQLDAETDQDGYPTSTPYPETQHLRQVQRIALLRAPLSVRYEIRIAMPGREREGPELGSRRS